MAAVFSGLLRTSVDGRQPCLAYLEEHRDLLVILTKGCAHTGAMLALRRVA